MEMVSVKGAKAALSEYVNRAAYGHERIVISSRGKPKAALISIEDLSRLEELELQAESEMLARAIEETREFTPLEEAARSLLSPDQP